MMSVRTFSVGVGLPFSTQTPALIRCACILAITYKASVTILCGVHMSISSLGVCVHSLLRRRSSCERFHQMPVARFISHRVLQQTNPTNLRATLMSYRRPVFCLASSILRGNVVCRSRRWMERVDRARCGSSIPCGSRRGRWKGMTQHWPMVGVRGWVARCPPI